MTKAKDTITVRKFYEHAINRGYMTGVARDKSRVKATGEVFTPDGLVREILDKINEAGGGAFTDYTKTFLDPSCGDGQFLVHVMLYKLTKGDLGKLKDDSFMDRDVTAEYIMHLKTIYGVDLMMDNIKLVRERLGMGFKVLKKTLMNNFRCENSLTYDFSFK